MMKIIWKTHNTDIVLSDYIKLQSIKWTLIHFLNLKYKTLIWGLKNKLKRILFSVLFLDLRIGMRKVYSTNYFKLETLSQGLSMSLRSCLSSASNYCLRGERLSLDNKSQVFPVSLKVEEEGHYLLPVKALQSCINVYWSCIIISRRVSGLFWFVGLWSGRSRAGPQPLMLGWQQSSYNQALRKPNKKITV